MPHPLTIGKLAKASDVSVQTIRYYEREGLMPEARRSNSGYRLYAEDSIKRLHFIQRAKTVGFTLGEIAALLDLSEDGDQDQASVKRLTQEKLSMVRAKLADLQRIEAALMTLDASCSGKGNIDSCPILNALSDPKAKNSQSP